MDQFWTHKPFTLKVFLIKTKYEPAAQFIEQVCWSISVQNGIKITTFQKYIKIWCNFSANSYSEKSTEKRDSDDQNIEGANSILMND